MGKFLVALVALCLANPFLARAENRLALIVTNESYPPEVGSLTKAHADGDIIGRALRTVGFDVRIVKDADKSELLQSVLTFAERLEKSGPDAVGFFYFSGHGAATEKFGDNYLIPTGAKIGTQIQLTALSVKLGEIVDVLAQTSAKTNFVVIDACRNVPFSAVRGQRGFKPEPERKGTRLSRAAGPCIPFVSTMGNPSRFSPAR